MDEIELALMQDPINQISSFSTSRLEHLSQAHRISCADGEQESLSPLMNKQQSMGFPGRLHLDLKVDTLLMKLQDCKVNMAEILEIYLPFNDNEIDIKKMELSNFKKHSDGGGVIQLMGKVQQKYAQSPTVEDLKEIQELNAMNVAVQDAQSQIRDVGLGELKQKGKQNKYEEQDQNNIHSQSEIQEIDTEVADLQLPSNDSAVNLLKQESYEINAFQQNLQGKTLNTDQMHLPDKSKRQENSQNRDKNQQNSQKVEEQEEIEVIERTVKGIQILQQINKEVLTFKKTLMLRQAQLGMLVYILENKNSPDFLKNYTEIYASLKQYTIPVSRLSQMLEQANSGSHETLINVNILDEAFEFETDLLNSYLEIVYELKELLEEYRQAELKEFQSTEQRQKASMLSSLISSTKSVESVLMKGQKALKSALRLKIIVINSKIITIAEIFPFACIKDSKDLFSCNKAHERWMKLFHNDIIVIKNFGEPNKVRKSFQGLKNSINIINASMNILNQNKNLSVFDYKNWGTLFQSTSKILRVALFKNDAEHEASVMISEPDGKLAKEIWNLAEQKMLKNFVSAVLPAIEYSQKLFIPRLFSEYFKTQGKGNLPEQMFVSHITPYGNSLYEQAPYTEKLKVRVNAKHLINRRQVSNSETEGHESQQSYAKIFFNTLNSMTKTVSNINSYFSRKKGQVGSTVILHIHGGGFISMSSFIHQTYTRNWANSLGVPIVSVDYGKAPEYPYPQGLYDCFEAYMWLRFIYRQIYQTEVERVILVGDSAGGNLVAALTTLLIEWNLPRPEGIVLVYPALNLQYENYTPSLLHALNDMILPHTFLKICLNSYLKGSTEPSTHPFISPINTKDSTLKKYPNTKIFVGNKDPFHDDCCRFVERLSQNSKNVADLTVFEEFPHGFLQFDMKTNPNEEARNATKQVENALKQLIELSIKESAPNEND